VSAETLEQTFTVSGPARLVVKNVRGSVQVRAGETGQVQVTAVKHTGTGDADQTTIEISQAEDGAVTAAVRFPERHGLDRLFSNPCKVDLTITVPAECSLDVRTVSAELVVEGLNGKFELHTVSGGIHLTALSGEMKLHSVSGDVRGQGLKGPLDVRTVSGDVRLEGSEIQAAHTHSVSGSLKMETGLGEGPYQFRSVSGDVRLQVPAEATLTAVLHSVSGGLSSNLPLTSLERRNGDQVAQVQGGGVTVSMNSVSGALRLGSPAA